MRRYEFQDSFFLQKLRKNNRIILPLLSCCLLIYSFAAHAQQKHPSTHTQTETVNYDKTFNANSEQSSTTKKNWCINCTDKKIHLYGITLTPGGYLAGEGFWRSRNEQSDIGSTFSGIPLGNNALYHMHEFRLSARQSRASLLIEGLVNPNLLLSGYYEIDFLGTGTANSNESNSFDARMRALYATLDQKFCVWSFHLLAGQNWTLATTNANGITPRNEVIPLTIDAQYVVGFVWKRQAQFRFTQAFGRELWAAISIENPQTTFGGTACGTTLPGITNQVCSAPGAQTLPSTSTFSLNHMPDIIAKLALESSIKENKLHLEIFGILRDFYDRVQHPQNFKNTNYDTWTGGFGGGLVIEVIKRILDLQGNFLAGHGIGSYGAGQLPDATISLNGSLAPIPEMIYMLGAVLHATPALDAYLYLGEEKESRKYFNVGSNFYGYGVPNANNVGCNTENGTCNGNTKKLWQVTIGLWDKLYQGAFGDLRAGLQYSYTQRELFSGNGGGTKMPISFTTNDNMIFFSLRYYPFM